MRWQQQEILDILDDGCRAFTFPMLDNGYVYLAATRLSLFRSTADWGMVIEVFGFSPRSGVPDTHVCTFASTLHDRDPVEKYVSEEAHRNYLKNNPHNDSRFVCPIDEGSWMDEGAPEHVAQEGVVVVRGQKVPLPVLTEYAQHAITLEGEQPAIYELCRYLAATRRDEVLASPRERRISILPDMEQILQLEEWHHPDVVTEELPSQVQSFQNLAAVLVEGDLYRPTEESNTHWKHWPDGGTL